MAFYTYLGQMGQQFLFVYLSCLVLGVSRWWCSAASRWEIGEAEQGFQHCSIVTFCVSARYRKCPVHTNLSFIRCLVKRKVRCMRKVDKLHITTDKGAGEQENSTVAPWAWICLTWLMILADGGSHAIIVQKPQIQSLKGLLVSLGLWPFPLGGH